MTRVSAKLLFPGEIDDDDVFRLAVVQNAAGELDQLLGIDRSAADGAGRLIGEERLAVGAERQGFRGYGSPSPYDCGPSTADGRPYPPSRRRRSVADSFDSGIGRKAQAGSGRVASPPTARPTTRALRNRRAALAANAL